MTELRLIQILISLGAVGLVVLHLCFPAVKVDSITLVLFSAAFLPWLAPLVASAKFPGGWEITLRDVSRATEKVMTTDGPAIASDSKIAAPAVDPSSADAIEPDDTPSLPSDPALALVGLRMEIERQIRKARAFDRRQPRVIIQELRHEGHLEPAAADGLMELIQLGNKAVHGATVEPAALQWAASYSPAVIEHLHTALTRKNISEVLK